MDKTCSTCEYSTENKHGGLLCLHPEIVASGIVLPVCVDDVCGLEGGHPMNPADLCRECELTSKARELERRLSEMAIEVVALTEENRVLKLRLKEEAE